MRRANFPDRREQRSVDAAERQAVWDGMSDVDRIERVRARTGLTDVSGTREMRRLRERAASDD